MAANKPKKRQLLRNNEYYDTQAIFDDLYECNQRGEVFTNLIELIISEQNIRLAYRSIKKNKGSKTKGVNSTTIVEMGEKQPPLSRLITPCLQGYHTHQTIVNRPGDFSRGILSFRAKAIVFMEDFAYDS